jgi:predicted glycosyltransferase
MATELLDDLGIEHRPLSYSRRFGGLATELVLRDLALARAVRETRPAVITAIGGIFAAHAGWLSGTRSVVFYDTENARLQNRLTYPLADRVIVPRAYEGWLPRHAERYPGYHELSYLHPSRFSPSHDIAVANGLDTDADTFLVRTVAWKANHDIGEQGWPADTLRHVVRELQSRGKVLISAEGELPEDLADHRYTGHPGQIHHVMAFARLFVGESATMASECAVLGVPSVYAAFTGRGYTNEQERRRGLVRNVRKPHPKAVVAAIGECLTVPAAQWRSARQRLLDECGDTASFIADTIEASARNAGAKAQQ